MAISKWVIRRLRLPFKKFYDHLSYLKSKLFLGNNSKKMEREGREAEREVRQIYQEKKSYTAKKNLDDVENCVWPFQWRLTVEE